jgi:hypothetical protein
MGTPHGNGGPGWRIGRRIGRRECFRPAVAGLAGRLAAGAPAPPTPPPPTRPHLSPRPPDAHASSSRSSRDQRNHTTVIADQNTSIPGTHMVSPPMRWSSSGLRPKRRGTVT